MNEIMASKSRVGAWLLLLSWLIGAGPLTLGLEYQQGQVLAALGLLVACALWWFANELLQTATKAARVGSFAIPIVWAGLSVLGGVVGIREGVWDWFPLLSLSMVTGVMIAGLISAVRRSRDR